MQRLKEETADLHRHAESRELQRAMAKGVVERERFAAYLAQLLLVHAALEAGLASAGDAHAAIGRVHQPYQDRSGDLRRDLEFFGVDAAAIVPSASARLLTARMSALASTNPLALLGMLYVLEGSNNGSKHIARSISRAFGIERGPGLCYLDPYGDQQMQRWQTFKRDMDGCAFSAAEMDAIVGAAKVMFSAISALSEEVRAA